ncbi:hypothetical protein [Chamaesiphon sp. VAR_48_metabat_403]|uniref:hypothetical protein n=1 Tax=Chamaesiphon sp. VAR_48_metabat_403 TaxID=2964700 RepID=UPI00286E195A|nr:hypothetical protein [Chamaesiphon sp. VAR_48_metabat_403]
MTISRVVFLLLPLLSIGSGTIALAQSQPSNQIECARAIPTPIVKKAIFPNIKFVLIPDLDRVPIGMETVRFNNGDRLIITNTGCESYIFNFQFETSRFAADINNSKYWYDRAVQLMRQVKPGIEVQSNIDRGIQALENYRNANNRLEIGKEINYGGEDIRSVVKLVEVQKTGTKKFLVTVNFYYGPL